MPKTTGVSVSAAREAMDRLCKIYGENAMNETTAPRAYPHEPDRYGYGGGPEDCPHCGAISFDYCAQQNCDWEADAAEADLDGSTGCADDALPGDADQWRKAADAISKTTIRQRLLSARRRFRDAVCAVVGHRWHATYNPGRQECARCHRQKYLMIDRATGATSWLVGN